MCGIAGWIERDCLMTERRGRLQAMSQTLERRGPDENGMYLNGDTALIHRRLVVIDRENGLFEPAGALQQGFGIKDFVELEFQIAFVEQFCH